MRVFLSLCHLNSKTCSVGLVNMFVECSGRNPCCVRARWTPGRVMFSIRRSVILDDVQSCVMKKVLLGLYWV